MLAISPADALVSVNNRAARLAWASPALLRAALLIGGLAVAALTLASTDATPYISADPALAHLLRAMALLKAAMVGAGFCLLFWRFGHAVTPAIAVTYLTTAWLTAAATAFIWQLSLIPLAALMFHGGLLAAGIAAWRDRGVSKEPSSLAGRRN